MLTTFDCILLGYYGAVALLLLRSPHGLSGTAGWSLAGFAGAFFSSCARRAAPGPDPERRELMHRTLGMGLLVVNYLKLRELLPMLQPGARDDELLRLDVALFGGEPVLWLEPLNARPVIEYFSFFYFSYFMLTLGVVAVVLWLERAGPHTVELTIGTALVYCLGQLGYVAVPAYGPIVHLAGEFDAPLDGGCFHALVEAIVSAGGAMKDVFPSLHTAAPTWFALFAARRAAHDSRWRWPARLIAFFAVNIVCSTLVLRWHYGVDVIAGLALALVAALAASRLAPASISAAHEAAPSRGESSC